MALLWVELGCKQVLLRKRRTTREAVVKGAGDNGLVIGHHVVAVNKIKTRIGLDAAPQGVINHRLHRVPAHVRYLQPLAVIALMRLTKEGDLARQHVEAGHAAVLFGARHQGLHADANR